MTTNRKQDDDVYIVFFKNIYPKNKKTGDTKKWSKHITYGVGVEIGTDYEGKLDELVGKGEAAYTNNLGHEIIPLNQKAKESAMKLNKSIPSTKQQEEISADTIEEKDSTKNHKMFCFRCGAEIPEKIRRKTDKYNTTKGRCPSCKRTAVFVTQAELNGEETEKKEGKKIRQVLEEEQERNKIIPSKVTASFNKKTVEMTGRIVAEKRKKGMPKTIEWVCEGCDNYCIKKMQNHLTLKVCPQQVYTPSCNKLFGSKSPYSLRFGKNQIEISIMLI